MRVHNKDSSGFVLAAWKNRIVIAWRSSRLTNRRTAARSPGTGLPVDALPAAGRPPRPPSRPVANKSLGNMAALLASLLVVLFRQRSRARGARRLWLITHYTGNTSGVHMYNI
jgi:hypothetical protein